VAGFDVIVCGSLHLDIVVKAPALPRPDETVVGKAWGKICGGKGGNQAVRAAEAGARTAMIGRVGADEFGETLRANLVSAQVDVSNISTDPVTGSGMSVAILKDDGDYGAVIVSGSNLNISAASLATQWRDLGGAKVLVLQNEIPHLANVAAAHVARANGAKVVFNAAPARDLGDDLPPVVDVLVVNRVEAEATFGKPVPDRATARAILEAMKPSAAAVVITLGGDGLVVADGSGEVSEIAPIPVHVTSTHGAGDCFVGVLAAELASGKTLLHACRLANQTAAAFVSRKTKDKA
jgi:ribokinase